MSSLLFIRSKNGPPSAKIGDAIDSLNHVKVYYNGAIGNVSGRNVRDGYNLGLKYQCVEFVKRYYFEHYKHRMPDSYGHAKSFYNPNTKNSQINKQRNLIQYTNPSKSKPSVGDLLVMDGNVFNPYGHVAIISNVSDKSIEIIQQNGGPTASTRVQFELEYTPDNKWNIQKSSILGWLRMKH